MFNVFVLAFVFVSHLYQSQLSQSKDAGIFLQKGALLFYMPDSIKNKLEPEMAIPIVQKLQGIPPKQKKSNDDRIALKKIEKKANLPKFKEQCIIAKICEQKGTEHFLSQNNSSSQVVLPSNHHYYSKFLRTGQAAFSKTHLYRVFIQKYTAPIFYGLSFSKNTFFSRPPPVIIA